jgi:NADH dehydrogenase
LFSCFLGIIFSYIAPTDNFETASQPTTTPEERKRLLSFVVCGGGPTGVETAAVRLDFFSLRRSTLIVLLSKEIYDFCQEDIMNYVRGHLSRTVILTP